MALLDPRSLLVVGRPPALSRTLALFLARRDSGLRVACFSGDTAPVAPSANGFDHISKDELSAIAHESFDAVFLVDDDFYVDMGHQKKLRSLKQHGVPVFFLFSRPILAPGVVWPRWLEWRTSFGQTGISHQGMFRLAGSYLSDVFGPGGGDFAEFGCFDGWSFAMAYHCLSHVVSRFLAFDSFEGILGSAPGEEVFCDGDWYSNKNTFLQNMRYAGLDLGRVQTIAGDYRKTLCEGRKGELKLGRVIAVHIDCDVRSSTRLALDFVAEHLADNALVLFDDWDRLGSDSTVGERRAAADWLADNRGFALEPWRNYGCYCRAFIFRRI